MKRIQKIVDTIYNKLNFGTDDCVYMISGKEGTGKSTLALQILDYWVKKKYGGVKPEHIKYISLDVAEWAESLKNSNAGDIIILDEGGQISSRRSMSKLNVAISQAYQICRGHRLFSILCLPSPFLIDSFFTTHRCKGMFYVYAKGRVAWYSTKHLEQTISYNAGMKLKKVNRVRLPRDHYDTYPIYNGVLKEGYDKKKSAFISSTFEELSKTISEIKNGSTDPIDEKIKEMNSQGYTLKEISEEIGIGRSSIGRRLSRIKKEELRA